MELVALEDLVELAALEDLAELVALEDLVALVDLVEPVALAVEAVVVDSITTWEEVQGTCQLLLGEEVYPMSTTQFSPSFLTPDLCVTEERLGTMQIPQILPVVRLALKA